MVLVPCEAQKKYKADTAKIALHSPRKAMLYSAALPGLGQIYNRQYWKAPIVYIGFGVIGYFIWYNNDNYNKYRIAYRDYYTENPDNSSYINLEGYNPLVPRELNLRNLQNGREYYRRYLEMSIIILAGYYMLNIIEANISAHFLTFDIDQDLTMKITPSVTPQLTTVMPATGLTFSFNF